jgi:hypothetical protein
MNKPIISVTATNRSYMYANQQAHIGFVYLNTRNNNAGITPKNKLGYATCDGSTS